MPAPIIDLLADLMSDEVTVEPHAGDDTYGTPVYATGVIVPARVIGKHRVIRGHDGQERVSNIQAWLASGECSVRDRFTLPARFGTPGDPSDLEARQPQALALDRFSDENGPHHQKVFF